MERIDTMKKHIPFRRIASFMIAMLMLVLTVAGCGGKDNRGSNTPTKEAPKESISVETGGNTAASKEQEETKQETKPESKQETSQEPTQEKLDKNGSYTSKEEVALYLSIYGRLPNNFITKAEAQKLGWTGGSLEKYAKGKCIGGDKFGNYEGLLPKGEQYYECDIDTLGASSRGAKRLVFTKSGKIYYTEDHYETFEKLY